eukprot:SAG31_NODE_1647_length_7645_cov_47.639544_6_plen_137_part_00
MLKKKTQCTLPGVCYLQDGCGGPRDSVAAMQQALNATGRDIVYSINSPKAQVNVTNPSYANLWRTTPDTSNTYVSMLNTALINNNATAIVSGAPGAWNDADVHASQPQHSRRTRLQQSTKCQHVFRYADARSWQLF